MPLLQIRVKHGLNMSVYSILVLSCLSCLFKNAHWVVQNSSSLKSFQVVKYLAGCGLQSCPMLLAKGYPDIGWNPCGGEKYLDFLRFAVFVNGLIFNLLHNTVFNSSACIFLVSSLITINRFSSSLL